MEHTPAQREAIIGGIDTLTQEIIKLKNNLTEILDYIDLRQKEADEQISQHRNLIDSFSDEIKELERILEEKKRNLSESQELQERYLRFAQGLSLMERSALDEYQQILNEVRKNISTSLKLEFLAPSYKKKLIDEYFSKEKLSIELIGKVLKSHNFGLEEIYDEKGTLACVFYKPYHGDLILSSSM